jgi:hypothetical protein
MTQPQVDDNVRRPDHTFNRPYGAHLEPPQLPNDPFDGKVRYVTAK